MPRNGDHLLLSGRITMDNTIVTLSSYLLVIEVSLLFKILSFGQVEVLLCDDAGSVLISSVLSLIIAKEIDMTRYIGLTA